MNNYAPRRYLLKDRKPVRCDDFMTWATDFETGEGRRVGQDTVNGVNVSTVFLGLDHQWGRGPPLLFETMIFGGKHDQFQERYSTWEEAEAGHARALALVLETA